MKKILLSVLCLCISIVMTGCSQENSSATSVSTGTNSSDNTTDNKYSSNELAKNITSNGVLSPLGKFIVFVKNNNNVPIDMKIEVEFYDAKGSIVGSDSEDLVAVGKNSEIAIDMYDTPNSFDNYKIYVDVEQTTNISYFDKIELTHNNNGENIVAQVKNNSQDTIEYVTVSVVYYQGNKIVGYDDGIESEIKPGRSANFNLNYPYNKNFDNIKFDNYKVFVNGAYTYNW